MVKIENKENHQVPGVNEFTQTWNSSKDKVIVSPKITYLNALRLASKQE